MDVCNQKPAPATLLPLLWFRALSALVTQLIDECDKSNK
jgi:hypothetical protein